MHESRKEIEAAIPHRPPMLLVDEIVDRDENRIHCRRVFSGDEFFFQGHYPNQPLVPGVILCEAAVQAGAILLSGQLTETGGVPVLTRMGDVKFKQMVRPGDTVDLEVTLDDRVSNAFYLTGKVLCAGKLAARLGFVCTMASAE